MITTMLALVTMALCSCGLVSQHVALPSVSPIVERKQWGVVVLDYARVHHQMDRYSTVEFHLRRGDIVYLEQQSSAAVLLAGERDYWYRIEADGRRGWLHGGDIVTHISESRARNAAAHRPRFAR